MFLRAFKKPDPHPQDLWSFTSTAGPVETDPACWRPQSLLHQELEAQGLLGLVEALLHQLLSGLRHLQSPHIPKRGERSPEPASQSNGSEGLGRVLR